VVSPIVCVHDEAAHVCLPSCDSKNLHGERATRAELRPRPLAARAAVRQPAGFSNVKCSSWTITQFQARRAGIPCADKTRTAMSVRPLLRT